MLRHEPHRGGITQRVNLRLSPWIMARRIRLEPGYQPPATPRPQCFWANSPRSGGAALGGISGGTGAVILRAWRIAGQVRKAWAQVERPDLARLAADGHVVIVFSDIEGFTEQNQALGDRGWVESARAARQTRRQARRRLRRPRGEEPGRRIHDRLRRCCTSGDLQYRGATGSARQR